MWPCGCRRCGAGWIKYLQGAHRLLVSACNLLMLHIGATVYLCIATRQICDWESGTHIDPVDWTGSGQHVLHCDGTARVRGVWGTLLPLQMRGWGATSTCLLILLIYSFGAAFALDVRNPSTR